MIKYQLGLSSEPITENPCALLDGVGLLRGEYLCRYKKEYFTIASCREYVKSYIENVLDIFSSQEVWYRTSEFSCEEINILKGCDHNLYEKQSLFGNRGIRRSILYPDIFDLELEIISEISKRHSNLHILFPFVTDDTEMKFCVSRLQQHGFTNLYGAMIEIPAAYHFIEQFIDLGITNFTIGLNDLTTFIFGVRRGYPGHNITHKIIYSFIENVVKKVNHRATVSVAGYLNKEFADYAINLGIQKLIIHYSDLNKVLAVPLDRLPYYDHLKKIKKMERQRSNNRDLVKIHLEEMVL